MLKKRDVITSSAIIALILSNATNVHAEEHSASEVHNKPNQETEVIVEEQNDSLSSKQSLNLSNTSEEPPSK